ncbi:MAG: hypothetical protein NTX86_05285 [Candidatus Dependentiae bacterium]|nr:hypothetical protein [Candidatus Dependentiae bacterium]
MFNLFNGLSDRNKGILLVATGIVLLLNTLGVLEKYLHVLVIIGAIYMIVVGLIKLEVHTRVMELMNKQDNNNNNNNTPKK